MRYVDPSGHSYATLPDGSRMSMNSPADVRRFNMLKQLPQTSQVKSTTAPASKPTPITGGIALQKSTETYTAIKTPEQIYASQKKNTSFLSSIFGAEYTSTYEYFDNNENRYLGPWKFNYSNVNKQQFVKFGDSLLWSSFFVTP